MARPVEIDGGAEEFALAAWMDFADGRLGPEIVSDARRYCPKGDRTQEREAAGQLRYQPSYRHQDDTSAGSLAESIEHHMENTTLVVSASGNDEREYAAYVELGHRVFHPSTHTVGPEVVAPEPFLRPALYQERGE